MDISGGYVGELSPAMADLDLCTRCGMCEQACPTYRLLRVEPDSPRGRVFLMKQVAEGAASVDPYLAEHLYRCLGCRACETACPSGVPYGRLLELARFQIEEHGALTPARARWRAFRAAALQLVLPNRFLFWLTMLPARLLQRWPTLAELLLKIPMPSVLRRAVAMIPPAPRCSRSLERSTPLPERSTLVDRLPVHVAVFTGCVMDALFKHVNDATKFVLEGQGCAVSTPRGQWCCGALNLHAGERRVAKAMARRNIRAFERSDAEAIVVNSAGCGATLKSYGELLHDDAEYAERASAFAAKVKDFSEFLVDQTVDQELSAPVNGSSSGGSNERPTVRVTYQDACHLAHGQRIRNQPRELLRRLSSIEYVELPFADRCCGAAGLYSLTHPDMAAAILAEKMECIDKTGCSIVMTANPGCHMQLHAGAALGKKRWRPKHIAELLFEAASSG